MSAVTMDRPLRHNHPVILDPMQIDHLSWQPVPGCSGVRAKELRRTDDSVCAVLDFEPGAGTPGHPHPHAQQHIWVLAGCITLGGRNLGVGSYVEVPAGVDHPIRAGAQSGCLLLQIHRPSASRVDSLDS